MYWWWVLVLIGEEDKRLYLLTVIIRKALEVEKLPLKLEKEIYINIIEKIESNNSS